MLLQWAVSSFAIGRLVFGGGLERDRILQWIAVWSSWCFIKGIVFFAVDGARVGDALQRVLRCEKHGV